MGRKMSELKQSLLQDEAFCEEYNRLEEEFALAAQLIDARHSANLTQADVARKMGTTQSVVARLESGGLPSLRSLKRYAQAVSKKIEIRVV